MLFFWEPIDHTNLPQQDNLSDDALAVAFHPYQVNSGRLFVTFPAYDITSKMGHEINNVLSSNIIYRQFFNRLRFANRNINKRAEWIGSCV